MKRLLPLLAALVPLVSWAGFPVLEDTNTSFESGNVLNHDIVLPDQIDNGDVCIIHAFFDNETDTTVTWDDTTTGAWELEINSTSGTADLITIVASQVMDGSEDSQSLLVTTSLQQQSVHITQCWSNVPDGVSGVEGSNVVYTTGGTPDANPPNFNPAGWDVADTTWVAGTAQGHGTDGVIVTFSEANNQLQQASNTLATSVVGAVSTADDASASRDPAVYVATVQSLAKGAYTLAIEGSAAAAPPAFTVSPTVTATTASSYTLSYTPDSPATFYVIGCTPGAAPPDNAADLIAEECGGGVAAHAADNEAVTGADTTLLTGVLFPRLDIYSILNNANGSSSVVTLADQDRAARTDFAIFELTSISATSCFADANLCDIDFDPNVAAGDIVEASSETSPGGFAITWDADGDFSYTDPTESRQEILLCIQDDSDATGEFTFPACWVGGDHLLVVNNNPPVNNELYGNEPVVWDGLNSAIDPIDLCDGFDDADGEQLTISVAAGTLPTGVALGGTGNCVLSGTPTVEDEDGALVTFAATDAANESATVDIEFYPIDTLTLANLVGLDIDEAVDVIVTQRPWLEDDILTASLACRRPGSAQDEVMEQDPAAGSEITAFEALTAKVAILRTCSALRRRH